MRKELAIRLGRRVAHARSQLGLTQEQLAAALEVDPITVSRFERGVSLPSLPTLERLARVLAVTMGDLLEGVAVQPATDAVAIAAMLEPLDADERAFVLDSVRRFAMFVSARKPRQD